MNIFYILITLLTSGLLSCGFVWLLFFFLFHPKVPVSIGFWKIQAFFPSIKEKLVTSISQIAFTKLGDTREFTQRLANPNNLEKLQPVIETHIDHFLQVKLKEVFPMLSMLIGEKTISQLKQAFLGELNSLFPVVMEQYALQLKEDIQVEQMIRKKIVEFADSELEPLIAAGIRPIRNRLLWISFGVGSLIGIIQLLITALCHSN